MILAGDIGGTKSLFALYADNGSKLIWEKRYTSRSFSTFSHLINNVLLDMRSEGQNQENINSACFAVAGPVKDNRCKTTNLPWMIDGSSLVHQVGIPSIHLLNDIEAVALSIPYLEANRLDGIASNQPLDTQQTIAIVAPGTGLGEAALLKHAEHFLALASEGGHKNFAPRSDKEFALFQFAKQLYPQHVSIERILGGNGFTLIYDFLKAYRQIKSRYAEADVKAGDSNANITRLALAQQCALCEEALEMYVSILAAECANVALQYMSLGGVILAGGIPPKILPALKSNCFFGSYIKKGRYQEILKKIPVFVCLEEKPALIGAANTAINATTVSKTQLVTDLSQQ